MVVVKYNVFFCLGSIKRPSLGECLSIAKIKDVNDYVAFVFSLGLLPTLESSNENLLDSFYCWLDTREESNLGDITEALESTHEQDTRPLK